MFCCALWLKVLSDFEPFPFSPSHPPYMAFHAVLSSPPLLSQLAGFLGYDHRSRSALEASCRLPLWEFRRWPVAVVARRGFLHSEPYACQRARAAYRVGAFLSQGPSFHQPDHRGRLCYYAVHPSFGFVTSVAFPAGHMPVGWHLLAPAPPARSCVLDPRYWRGDLWTSWSTVGFPDSWPLSPPSFPGGVSLPLASALGLRGLPGLPPGVSFAFVAD